MIVGPKCGPKNPISLRVQVTNISSWHGRARLLSSYFCFIELLGELLDYFYREFFQCAPVTDIFSCRTKPWAT